MLLLVSSRRHPWYLATKKGCGVGRTELWWGPPLSPLTSAAQTALKHWYSSLSKSVIDLYLKASPHLPSSACPITASVTNGLAMANRPVRLAPALVGEA